MALSPEESGELARETQEEVAAAASSAQDEAELRRQREREMLTFIGEMRAEVDRVGPFGAQIGDGIHATFFLAEPLPGTYTLYEGGEDMSCLTYVVATVEGFHGLQIPDKPSHKEVLAQLRNAIGAARQGIVAHTGQGIPGYWNHGGLSGRRILVPDGKGYTTSYGDVGGSSFVDVSGNEVREARRLSLTTAQGPLDASAAAARDDLQIIQDIRADLQE
ncbi:hypothetical protein A2957_02235 [Candidatus Roizmanbacteria bacterium RIFCSPLOWO2_01_FULL_38_11]|uniref:Uncharacterized protein n=1 Tax=Candidatus Roizmanbacteria bacterium RIFCSPLOWO2_01_FULL_38_11 TaxID=1802060 RepID=A0A1F7IP40_9BACT|nr:MAG: hypothetical protein A2957_02235 [Candidatus Roizmanbacteria bacterium RIFCSPLOWO2_01_FULL_38_11]